MCLKVNMYSLKMLQERNQCLKWRKKKSNNHTVLNQGPIDYESNGVARSANEYFEISPVIAFINITLNNYI